MQEIFGLEENIRKEQQQDPDAIMCVICISEQKNTIVMPCGHLCVCKPCAITLASSRSPDCPVCRKSKLFNS